MSQPIAETNQTYDLIAAEYAKRNATVRQQVIDQINALISHLPPGSLVADIGCGPGRDTHLMREQGVQVVGLDLSIGQLRTSKLPAVAQADMRHLPLQTGSVGAIWCKAALVHIPREAVPAVLAEFARAMRVGGELYLSVAEGDGEGFEVASKYRSACRRWFTFHRQPELTALLETTGFAVHGIAHDRTDRDWLLVHARRSGGGCPT